MSEWREMGEGKEVGVGREEVGERREIYLYRLHVSRYH